MYKLVNCRVMLGCSNDDMTPVSLMFDFDAYRLMMGSIRLMVLNDFFMMILYDDDDSVC
ncbi:hypothetical protein HanRHA438_Chr17g0811501 [Helianthus annuus]|nr:hypothetical protein HanRHA438_Chr17g0811501 [Helianthus annuus]